MGTRPRAIAGRCMEARRRIGVEGLRLVRISRRFAIWDIIEHDRGEPMSKKRRGSTKPDVVKYLLVP